MKDLLEKYTEELKNAIKAMSVVKEQISVYNKKGHELSAHATYLNGKIDAIKELINNKEEQE